MQRWLVGSHASRPAAVQALSSVQGISSREQPLQFRRTRAPAIWICEVHPRRAARRALKSNNSCTSVPESCIFEIELSNGKMLYICLSVTGPGTRSVRMPVEFVSEKSVWMPRRSHIAVENYLTWWLVAGAVVAACALVVAGLYRRRTSFVGGSLVCLALAAARIVSLLSVRKSSTLVTLLLGIIIAVFAVASFLRLPVWRDSTTLWTDAIEKAPAVSRSYFNLAGYYFEHQQYDSTARLLKQYIELKPDDFLGYSKLRQAYFLAGRYEDAGFVSRQIIARNPLNAYRYLEAGMMYEQLHRYDSAAALYHEGLAVDSNAAVLRFHLGAVYAAQQDTMRAIDMIERGMNTGTPAPESVRLLHELYARTGQDVKARQLSERYHF